MQEMVVHKLSDIPIMICLMKFTFKKYLNPEIKQNILNRLIKF